MASPNLVVGSLIGFQSKLAPEDIFTGKVYFFEPESGRFGITDVMRQINGVDLEPLKGIHQFFLKDIKDLKVIPLRSPKPGSTTNTEQDDQKSNPGSDAASTSSSK